MKWSKIKGFSKYEVSPSGQVRNAITMKVIIPDPKNRIRITNDKGDRISKPKDFFKPKQQEKPQRHKKGVQLRLITEEQRQVANGALKKKDKIRTLWNDGTGLTRKEIADLIPCDYVYVCDTINGWYEKHKKSAS